MEIPDWIRAHFTERSGKPFLFYVAYGPFPEAPTVSASRYRCAGIPTGIEVMTYGPLMEPDVVSAFRTSYLWEKLQLEDASLARSIGAQTQCVVLRGEVEDRATLNDFRDVVGFLAYLLDSGCVGIFDPQMFKWWSPADWRQYVFEPAAPSPRSHVTILFSEDGEGTEWFHTRGMRKFGRPDLSVRYVPVQWRDPVIELCNRFIEYQALGGTIAEGEEIRMPGLPNGMQCFHRGHYEDPEFNNVHVEVRWPNAQQALARDVRNARA